MAQDSWVQKKLKALNKQEPPAADEEAVKRAERHASGTFTVVKAGKE
jgi:hypothetical protein